MFKIDQPKNGFRSAMQKYYDIFSGQFANPSQPKAIYQPSITTIDYNVNSDGSNTYNDYSDDGYKKRFDEDEYGLANEFEYYFGWAYIGIGNNVGARTRAYHQNKDEHKNGRFVSAYQLPESFEGQKFYDRSIEKSDDPLTEEVEQCDSSLGVFEDTIVGFLNQAANYTANDANQSLATCTKDRSKKITIKRKGSIIQDNLGFSINDFGRALSQDTALVKNREEKQYISEVNEALMTDFLYPSPYVNYDYVAKAFDTTTWGYRNIQNALDSLSYKGIASSNGGYPAVNFDNNPDNDVKISFDCISMDRLGLYGIMDFNRKHFEDVRYPLTYDKISKKPVVYLPFANYEYIKALKNKMTEAGFNNLCLIGNRINEAAGPFISNQMNNFIGEYDSTTDLSSANRNYYRQFSFQATDKTDLYNYLDRQRALAKDKAYTIWFNNYSFGELGNFLTLKHAKIAMSYGFFSYFYAPSKDIIDANTGASVDDLYYFARPKADHPAGEIDAFKSIQKMTTILAAAKWQPLNNATVNDPEIKIECFGPVGDNQKKIYYTIRNQNLAEKSFNINLDHGLIINPSGSIKNGLSNTDVIYSYRPDPKTGTSTTSLDLKLAGEDVIVLEVTGDTTLTHR